MTVINNSGPISNNKFITIIDPIDALIGYINDIKPYHSKIVEINVEYTYTESANFTFKESLLNTWSMIIIGATAGPSTSIITVSGDETENLMPSQKVIILGSTSDDGIYVVLSVLFDGTQTQITILGTLPITGTIGGTLSYTTQIV